MLEAQIQSQELRDSLLSDLENQASQPCYNQEIRLEIVDYLKQGPPEKVSERLEYLNNLSSLLNQIPETDPRFPENLQGRYTVGRLLLIAKIQDIMMMDYQSTIAKMSQGILIPRQPYKD